MRGLVTIPLSHLLTHWYTKHRSACRYRLYLSLLPRYWDSCTRIHIDVHWYTARPMHGLPHFILCHVYILLLHLHVMFTYYCYTYMSCLHITVMHVWFLYSCHMIPRSYYMYYYSMFPYSCYMIDSCYNDMDIPDTGHESCWYAICGLPHLLFMFPVILFMLYCSRFSLYCSMLSTELWSSYHVTRIMYCICSCYIVYLTYQIIKLTGVWGRLDGWLDHIGWMSGSIVRPTAGDGVVLATICYSCYMLQL